MTATARQESRSPIEREGDVTIPVYNQFSFVPERGDGCDIITVDGRRILDLYGGHAVAALGYGHPGLTQAIEAQSRKMLFQSNAVGLDIRAAAAEALVSIGPDNLSRAFFVNSGAEANENALRIACMKTGRKKVLAVSHGFHGRTAAAAAVTWNARDQWYGFPNLPFDVEFIPRDDVDSAAAMIDNSVAAVIFEPVQGIAGAYDLSAEFVNSLRDATTKHNAILIADEVQCGMGRTGWHFAVQAYGIEPDILTSAKGLGGGIPCGAVLTTEDLSSSLRLGDLGSTFGGGPLAAAAMVAVMNAIDSQNLLNNVRQREAEIRQHCIAGPVLRIQGKGLLLGLICNRPAKDVQQALLKHDILTGTSAEADVLRLLPPLILKSEHVHQLADTLVGI